MDESLKTIDLTIELVESFLNCLKVFKRFCVAVLEEKPNPEEGQDNVSSNP